MDAEEEYVMKGNPFFISNNSQGKVRNKTMSGA